MRTHAMLAPLFVFALAASLLLAPAPARAVVDDRVDLNQAEAEDFGRFADILEEVDIEAILQARVDRGDFRSVEEIASIIGQDKFTEIQDDIYVTVPRPKQPTVERIAGSARFEVRDRAVNDAFPLIKSRSNYDNAPEYRQEYRLSSGDAFEGFMRLKRSAWQRTNSKRVYERRAAFNDYETVKVEKKKRARKIKEISFVEGADPSFDAADADAADPGAVDADAADADDDETDAPGVPAETAARETAADGGDGAAGKPGDDAAQAADDATDEDEEDEAEGDDAPAAEAPVAARPLCLRVDLYAGRGTSQVALLADQRLFSDPTGEVVLDLRIAAEPPADAPANLFDVETLDGQAKFGIRFAPVPAKPLADATPADPPLPDGTTAAVALTTPASTVAVELTSPESTVAVELASPDSTAAVELASPGSTVAPEPASPESTVAVELASPGSTTTVELAAPPAPIRFSLTLERVSGGRAADELLHRTFDLGTGEAMLRHILLVRSTAGAPDGAPLPLRILRSRTRDGVVSLRVAAKVDAPAPVAEPEDEADEADEQDLVADGDAAEPKITKKRSTGKKKSAKKSTTKKKKSAKKKPAKHDDGLEFVPSRVGAVVKERTVEVAFAEKKILRRRLELGNVSMAPVRKPLLAYTTTIPKRGAKYYFAGNGMRDTLLYTHATDQNLRLYGNHVEFDLPGGGVAGSQLYRIEAKTEAKDFTNLNLYGTKKFGETTLHGEWGRVPGGADAVYFKSDTRLKKMSVYTVLNAIEPRYDDEDAARPFSMTRFQEYGSAYFKVLWKPDKAVTVTAKKSVYERGQIDLQNGETRNAADSFLFRYVVTPSLTLRADLYRTVTTGDKEGHYVRFRSMWKALPDVRIETSHKYYDYNAAAGASAKKNSQHFLYGAWTLRKGLVVKAKGDRLNQDDRDVLTNTAGFEWKVGKDHYVELETENERITGKLVPTVQIETQVKAKYVYSF